MREKAIATTDFHQLSLLCRKEATRTPDPYVPNVVRYQLRYFPIKAEGLASACALLYEKCGVDYNSSF